MSPDRRLERAMQCAVVALAAIGAARAVGRIFSLLFLPADYRDLAMAGLVANADDAHYARQAGAVLAHAIPALLFIGLAPFQFVRRIRAERPELHRWSGRVCVAAGLLLGAGGLVLAFKTALDYGGPSETSAAMALGIVLLFSLGKAVMHIRRGEIAQHREWMIRAFAMGLAAGSVTVVGMFFAISTTVRAGPRPFLGTAFWLGFTINLIGAEAWINYTRPRTLAHARPAPVALSNSRS